MKWVRKLIHGITIVIFMLLVCIVFLQVIFRVTGISSSWSEELARFLLIWLSFLAGYITVSKGQNITFDLVLDSLPGIIWKPVFTLVNLVSIIFLAIIIWLGFQLSLDNMSQLSSVMRFPIGYIYLAIPVGCIGMVLAQIQSYFELIKEKG